MPQGHAFGPYSLVRRAGDFYFVSGQVGVDPETKVAGKTIEEQTAQVLVNIASILSQEGLGMEHVIKTTIYVTNVDEFAALNNVYEGHFQPPRPARATLGIKELPRVADVPLKVEIEAVAYKGGK